MKLSQYSGAQFRPWDTVLNKTQLCAPALQFPFSSSLGPLVYRARARTDLVQMLSRRSLHQKTAQVQMLSRRSLHQKTAQVQMLSRRSLPETTSPLQTTSSRFTFGSISLDIAPAIRKTPWRFRAQRCRRNSGNRFFIGATARNLLHRNPRSAIAALSNRRSSLRSDSG